MSLLATITATAAFSVFGQGRATAAPLTPSGAFISGPHAPVVGGVYQPETVDSAFTILTNGVVDHGGAGFMDNVDTWNFDESGVATDFVGLRYAAAQRFDTIMVELGNQFGDGGDWQAAPKLYILKNPRMAGATVRPELSSNWAEVTGAVETMGHTFSLDVVPGAGGTIKYDLSAIPAADRTGYGWVLGGVDGNQNLSDIFNFISLTEVSAEGEAAPGPIGLTPPATPQVMNVVSNNYNSPNYQGQDFVPYRAEAFQSVTNGVVEHFAGGDGFDNWNADLTGVENDFIGLQYNTRVRFDTVTVELGNQFVDGGDWETTPKVYILKHPVDTDTVAPDTDPENWRELPAVPETSGHTFTTLVVPGDGGTITLDLTGLSEELRTGWGFAVGGVDGNHRESDLAWNFVSFTEVLATGIVTITGDANGDGVVDIFDVNVASDQWGTYGPDGDVNYDGVVDIFDVNVISDTWTTGGVSSVPEPTSAFIALCGFAGLAAWRRGRASRRSS